MSIVDSRSMSWAELDAAGLCDCGDPLDGHPPLPAPLPWGHGRPCALTSLDRGQGWDGRPLPAHTDRETRRWSTREQRVRA